MTIQNPFKTISKEVVQNFATEMFQMIREIRTSNRIACYVDNYDVVHRVTVGGLLKSSIHSDGVETFVRLEDRMDVFSASYGHELYAKVTKWHSDNGICATSGCMYTGGALENGSFSLYYGSTLIRGMDCMPLCVYNVPLIGSVQIRYHFLRGGAPAQRIILPTYSHVKACEDELTGKVQFVQQGADEETAYDRQFRAETNLYTMIGQWLGAKGIDGEFVEKLIEDVHIFIRLVLSSKDAKGYNYALISFIKFRTGKTLFSQKNIEAMFEYISHLFDDDFQRQSVEDVFGCAKTYLDKYEELKNAPIFKKLYKLLMYALSFSVFDALGINFDLFKYTALEAEAIKRKYHMGADFVHTLLSTLLFVCERGYQCMKTGSLDPIYHSGSEYEKWFDRAALLKRRSLLLAFPEASGFTLFEYLADLRETIEQGEAIYKHASRCGEFERKMVRALVNDLHMILANQTTKREAQKERDAPFCICLYGGSSIGKTTITDMLFLQYGKTFDLPLGSEFKYTHNPTAKYWDGFNSSQWFVIMDDIAFMHPNKASEGDPSVMETIQTNNRVAFVPDQAALEDKGRTPFRARCVVATTNCEDLNAVHYFQTPLAMQRRFPYTIDVTVKDQYCRDECMLDSSKTQIVEGEWPNYWNFVIKRPVPVGKDRKGQRAKLEVVERFTDVNDFLAWFSRVSVEHERIQKLVGNSAQNMVDLKLCAVCYRTLAKCNCYQKQSKLSYGERAKKLLLDGAIGVCRTDAFHSVLKSALATDEVHNRLEDLLIVDGGITGNPIYADSVSSEEEDLFDHSVFDAEPQLLQQGEVAYDSDDDSEFSEASEGSDSDNESFNQGYRRMFARLGERVKKNIGAPELIGSLIAACGILMGAYKLYSYLNKDYSPQGNVLSSEIGKAPPATEDRSANVWFRDEYELSSFDVSSRSTSWNSLSQDQLAKQLLPNTVHFAAHRIKENGVAAIQNGRAVCLAGHVYITNNHNLSTVGDLQLQITTAPIHNEGINQSMTILITQRDIKRYPEKDLCVVRLRCLPPKKNISELFAKGCVAFKSNGLMISRNERGAECVLPVRALHKSGAYTDGDKFSIASSWQYAPMEPTVEGDCGAMVVGTTNMGPMIVGLHAMGKPFLCEAMCTAVTAEFVEKILSEFIEPIVQCGTPMLTSPSAIERPLRELHEKSVFRYIDQGTANVYGSFSGFKQAPKSRVGPTLIQEAVVEEGYEVKHGPPVMKGWAPWRIAAVDMVKPVTQLDKSVLEECTQAYLEDVMSHLTEEDLAEVMVYDDLTALNGAAGVKFVDKMNRNTSMGNPFQKGKKHFLEPIPAVNGLTEPMKWTQEIEDRINKILEAYLNGERAMPNFCGHLKDDPTTWKKILAMKTRMFSGGASDWATIVRKYLLSVIRLIQRNKFVFETAVGTNACSTEWEEIREFLVQFGEDSMIAGDYAAFDKTMPAEVILAAFDILREICKAAGYSSEDLLVIQCIAEDTAFPLTDFNGDLVEFYGSNPSGHPLTVIINSIANSLYMRYCYHMLNPAREVRSFRRNVALMTYGDDNVMGVNKKKASWFSHTTVQNELARAGITYTMADKETESIPYITIDEVSFLKRTWRWDEDVGAYLAPLEEDSISKSLTVCVRSKTLSPEYHAVAIMESAYCEYFFYGKEKFLAKQLMFKNIVLRYELGPYLKESSFPTWEDLKERFWSGSKKRQD